MSYRGLEMGPLSEVLDPRYLLAADAETSSDLRLCDHSTEGTNLKDIALGKFSKTAAFAPIVCPRSALRNTIRLVLDIGSQEQMERIHAGWGVAFVKNIKAFWDRAELKHPRYAVGTLWSPLPIRKDLDVAIASRVFCSKPKPAGTVWPGTIHLPPESLRQGASARRHGRIIPFIAA